MQTYSAAEPRRTPSPDIVRRPTMSPATNQQYDIYTPSRRSPLSEIVRGSSRRSPPPDIAQRFPTAPPARGSFPPQRDPEFLIVGLFALRLTKHLIGGLEHYFGRDADVAWLANFLAPFPHDFALAKISGHRKQDYETSYQNIVARMKRQSRYPMRFMQLNPDKSMQRQHEGREAERERPGEISDIERLDIIDFCDAAAEWGSIVPIPAREADRMIELADQRRIADSDEPRASREDRHVRFEERRR